MEPAPMPRALSLALAATVLVVGLALAEPGVEVRYNSGVPQIRLIGSYPQSHYTLQRASSSDGPFAPITELDVLCLGPCYGDDPDAIPGRTYWYRFDLVPPDGPPVSFGPYAVTIASGLARPVGIGVFPNPGQGTTRVDLFLAGARGDAPVSAEAALYDPQGRRVVRLLSGTLPRGMTSLSWDGRGDDGRLLAPGPYFLRFSSPLGSSVARILRVR